MLETKVLYFFILIKISSCTSTTKVFFQDVVATEKGKYRKEEF